MPEKEYKWIVPELPSKIKRKSVRYLEALEYLNEVKVCSRYDLNMRFSSYAIGRLLKNENVGFINLCRQSPKYKVYDLFVVPAQLWAKLFIIYLKGDKDALVRYLASLIKQPLDKRKMKALSWRLRKLDYDTRLRVIQMAGYDRKNRYDECVEEFFKSGLESARVDLLEVKLNSLYALLKDSIEKKGLKGKMRACRRRGKVYLVRLQH